ncbi:MlrC C-terminus family protein [Gordoniibacillus kamchatkensis]|uniref:MlrC C-terminus family protein n=1 Tax=Gordoniibacillus kamchatkensis TaxID=1590651 RepID=A0ABR5AH07_9BACL|nr:M81 family metallopeptidase [Paenibacillus sp. VKM B-2647]KIL40333.1 MlrC C-terminus family protein [Paenibacillus sp. VKM B-2647]
MNEHGQEVSLKVAVVGILHETNTFAPGLTGLDDFTGEWIAGKEAFYARYEGTRTSMGGVIAKARELGIELIPGLYAAATPSGMVAAGAMETLMGEVLRSVDRTADAVIVIMHGAMVAEHIPDVEGEFLERLRGMVGYGLPVAMTLDLHGNISRRMVELADIIVGYDTYPHVDMFERAEEALELLWRTARGQIRPVRALAQPAMLVVPQAMLTEQGAMRELMEEAFALEKLPGVLNVTVAGGFPYSDVPDAGMAFVVTTDNDLPLAERSAEWLSELARSRKEKFAVRFVTPEDAVRLALAEQEGPIVLTEGSDNVGGGSPGDATHLLALLVDPQVPALVVIRDVEAVAAAFRAGIGGMFETDVGGKSDTLHGCPVRLHGKVRTLFDGIYRHVGPYMTGQLADMGHTAVVECGKLTVVLTEKRQAPWDLGHVRSVGLWPADFHIIVVKSAIAWQTAFGPFAKKVIHVESPGCCTSNLHLLTYRLVRRPVYPL